MDLQSSPVPDPYNPACPTRLVLDRIGDKWTVLLVGRLMGGPMRFTALRRSVPGLSQKVLTQVLRGLERDGLVDRRVLGTVPRHVEYALTPLGGTLSAMLASIREWSEKHIGEVLAAQAAYDARPPAAPTDPQRPSGA